MNSKGRLLIPTVAALLLAVSVSPAWAGGGPTAHQYRMIDLGTLGGNNSSAIGINNHGVVVGGAETSNGGRDPYLWRNGHMINLGGLPGSGHFGTALAVNNRDEVVGAANFHNEGLHAFLWRNGHMTDLGTLGGRESSASSINDRGDIVGSSQTTDGSYHGFLWRAGHMRDLGPLIGRQINNRGQILGAVPQSPSGLRSGIWSKGHFTPLVIDGQMNLGASAINNAGCVAGGTFHQAKQRNEAFRWCSGRTTWLGVLRAGWYGMATAINDRGQILGWATSGNGEFRYVLWQNGRMVDLSTHGVPYMPATGGLAINNQGKIVGIMQVPGPYGTLVQHAVLFV